MRKSKILSVIAVLAIVGTILSGCGADPIKDDIMSYMEKLPEIQTIESAIKESFNTVVGDNYKDDATLLNELEALVPASDELLKATKEIVPATTELAAVHTKYIDGLTSLNGAFVIMADAITNADADMMAQGSDLMKTALTQDTDFDAALIALAKEHNLEIK